MSDYVKERAERVLGLLDEEDRKVVAEYVRLKQAEATESQRYRHEGPPWGAWALAVLLLGPFLGALTHGAVGCLRSEEVRSGKLAAEDLAECREDVANKQAAIVRLGETCGGER